MNQRQKNTTILIPIILLLANAILKIWYLSASDIALDEPFTLFYSQQSLAAIFDMLKNENNPPVFFLLGHFWVMLSGIEAFGARLLPWFFSVITVFFLYKTAVRFFGFWTGLTAALLFTFSNFNIYLAHEFRTYSLLVLLVIISFYAFLRLCEQPGQKRIWLLLTATNAVLMYTHFFGLVFIFFQFLTVLIFASLRQKILKKYILHLLVLIACFAPYLPIFINRFLVSKGNTWVHPPTIGTLWNFFWSASNKPVPAVIFCVSVLFYFLLKKIRKSPYTVYESALLFQLFVPIIVLFFVSLKIPVFLVKYLAYFHVLFYLVIALAAYEISQFLKLEYLTVLWILPALFTFNPNYQLGYKPAKLIKWIEETRPPESVVVFGPPYWQLCYAYHLDRDIFKQPKRLRELMAERNIFPIYDLALLDKTIANYKDVYYLEASNKTFWGHKSVLKKLDKQCNLIDSNNDFHSYSVYQYRCK